MCLNLIHNYEFRIFISKTQIISSIRNCLHEIGFKKIPFERDWHFQFLIFTVNIHPSLSSMSSYIRWNIAWAQGTHAKWSSKIQLNCVSLDWMPVWFNLSEYFLQTFPIKLSIQDKFYSCLLLYICFERWWRQCHFLKSIIQPYRSSTRNGNREQRLQKITLGRW